MRIFPQKAYEPLTKQILTISTEWKMYSLLEAKQWKKEKKSNWKTWESKPSAAFISMEQLLIFFGFYVITHQILSFRNATTVQCKQNWWNNPGKVYGANKQGHQELRQSQWGLCTLTLSLCKWSPANNKVTCLWRLNIAETTRNPDLWLKENIRRSLKSSNVQKLFR